MSISIHVGPYFRCKCVFGDVQYLSEDTCLNANCKNHKKYVSGKFCQECGGATGKINLIKNGPLVKAREVTEELDESLYVPGINNGPISTYLLYEIHTYCINRNSENPIIPVKRDSRLIAYSNEQNFTPLTITSEKEYLVLNFYKELKVLEKHYGKENVEVCWGVINYTS